MVFLSSCINPTDKNFPASKVAGIFFVYTFLLMTRIGLISDTHHYLDESVFKYFDKCDEIWHAGDFVNHWAG